MSHNDGTTCSHPPYQRHKPNPHREVSYPSLLNSRYPENLIQVIDHANRNSWCASAQDPPRLAAFQTQAGETNTARNPSDPAKMTSRSVLENLTRELLHNHA